MTFLAQAIFLQLALVATIAQPQPSSPAHGIQLGGRSTSWDVRFPLTVAQCEPVFVYYNNTANIDGGVGFGTLDGHFLLFIGPFPFGAGYFEWICNIPAGFAFVVYSDTYYPTVVQPGSSSSCLRDITATYERASYSTADFMTFTASRPITTPTTYPFSTASLATSTVPFPTGSFPTITVNPEFIVATTSSRKPNTTAIVGGVVGGIAVAMGVLVIILIFRLRKRPVSHWHRNVTDQPVEISPPTEHSGWTPNAPISAVQTEDIPSITSGSNMDPSVLHSNLSSADAFLPTEQSGGPLWTSGATPSMVPTSNPPADPPPYPQPQSTPQSMYPQLDIFSASDPNARQQAISVNPYTTNAPSSPNVTVPHAQSTSPPGPADRPNILTVLDTFSQLPSEERRALVRTLSAMAGEPSANNEAPKS